MGDLILTPLERAARSTDAVADGERRAALWGANPEIAAALGFHLGEEGFVLDVVDTAEELLRAAHRAVLLVVDCTAAADALDRCRMILPHVALPVYICHPDAGFVDDLRPLVTSELTWLPPEWLGIRLRDKLRLLVAPPTGAPDAGPDAAPSQRLTDRQRAVLALAEDGHSNRAIAARLGLSTNTIKTHLANARRKRNGDEREGPDTGEGEGMRRDD